MKNARIIIALLLVSLCFLAALNQPPVSACAGSSGSVCVVTQTACLKTVVAGIAIPRVQLRPPGTPFTLDVPVSIFVACPTPPPGSCGNPCPGGITPNFSSFRVDVYPFPLPDPLPATPLASAIISSSNGTMIVPPCSQFGTFSFFDIFVDFSLLPNDAYSLRGTATLNFPDGTSLKAAAKAGVCLVDPAPGNPSVPRLDVELLNGIFPSAAPGEQHNAMYKITNNDPTNSVSLTAFVTSSQNALRPRGANEKQGVYAISNPFGDDFPIMFDPASCIPLPEHPYKQPEIVLTPIMINPLQSTTVIVGIRSYPQCASGSCSESTLRVEGTFADTTPAKGCGALIFFVDTAKPTTGCGLGINDCNNNGVYDPIDIATGTSQDHNFNAVPDECDRGFAPIIPNPVQVSPPVVTIPTELISLSLVSVSPINVPITNAWANGFPLNSTDGGHTWQGQIPSDPEVGPHTVYAMVKDASGQLATHIGTYCHISATLSPTSYFFTPVGDEATVMVMSTPNAPGCTWTAETTATWITVVFADGGPGNGEVHYAARDNTGPAARANVIGIAGKVHSVTQDSEASADCPYAISPRFMSISSAGGIVSFQVITEQDRCAWGVRSSVPWIRIISNNGQIGPGTVDCMVDPHSSTTGRNGTVSLVHTGDTTGQDFRVKQKGAATLKPK